MKSNAKLQILRSVRSLHRRHSSEAEAAAGESYSQWLKAVENLAPTRNKIPAPIRNNIPDSELIDLLE